MQCFSERSERIRYIVVFALVSILTTGSFSITVGASDASLKAETARNISNDDLTGEDLAIRRVAVEALGTAAGTVVVMNARTGRIYTIVNQAWAIRNAFKPCSTIKLVTGVAGLHENLIGPDGSLSKTNDRLGLDEALAYSNNSYFQKVGTNLGSAKLIDYALALGLGEITGINSPGEVPGKLPVNNENLRIYSHADDFEVTTLQLAVMVSALTNGGKLVVPQIARTRNQKANFRGFLRREIGIGPETYERVIPGMMGAVGHGTASIIDNKLEVAGKTGSCISKGTWVGLFASVAPVRDPRYSVVVITNGNGARGKYSAAIAGKIYQALKPGFGRRNERSLIAMKTEKRNSSSGKADRTSPEGTVGERSNPPKEAGIAVRSNIRKTSSRRPTGTNTAKPPSKESSEKSIEEMFPTIVIVKGKTEITRPRVIND